MADSPSPYIGLTALGLTCALGSAPETILRNAQAMSRDGMRRVEGLLPNGETSPFGFCPDLPLPERELRHNPDLKPRCLQLLDIAIAQIQGAVQALLARVPAERIGVVLGTSNSTMEEFTALPDAIDMSTPARYLRDALWLRGPAYAVSTACSSSAKVFASARSLITSGTCQAVIVGGVDSFARVVQGGFFALEALSTQPTQPLAAGREGINLGEGAALFVMEAGRGEVELAGVGESSDAYHLTAPEPSGRGALAAMRAALEDAHLAPEAVDYINLHGTGTPYNDRMECAAIATLFGEHAPCCSSTKPLTGHTLGAAGAIEAALCYLMLTHRAPAFPHPVPESALDPDLPRLPIARPGAPAPRTVLSNAFAFGGSNATLILRRREEAAPEVPPPPPYSLDDLLPHRAPMSLLSGYDPASFSEAEGTPFRAWVVPSERDLLYDGELGGVPPCASVEYMAQTVAAYVGLRDRRNGHVPRVGFFLGTRRLKLALPRFEPGRCYTIAVTSLFSDESFASFQAAITDDAGQTCAEANLNVFRPEPEQLAQFAAGEISTF